MGQVTLSCPLVLASASPRRKEILEQLGFRFRVEVSDADESVRLAEDPPQYVERVAHAKAEAVVARLRGDTDSAAVMVLAADTTVALDGDIIGKPGTDVEAQQTLGRLSGRTHHVWTCVVGMRVDGRKAARTVCTEVTFRALTQNEIDAYVATGEGRDKAGAYAAQGRGSGLVRSLKGSFTNVVGLPAAETIDILKELGCVEAWPT